MQRIIIGVIVALVSLASIVLAAETRGLRVVAKDQITNQSGEKTYKEKHIRVRSTFYTNLQFFDTVEEAL